MKVLKEILVVLLSIVAFVSLLGFLFLFSTENIISKQNVANVIKKVDVKELIGEEGITELDESLKESGLPEGMAEDILANKEFQRIFSEYSAGIFHSLILSDKVVIIDQKKFADDLNKIVDILVVEARKNGVEIDEEEVKQAHDEIVKNSKKIISEVNNSIIEAKNSIEEESFGNVLKTVRSVYKTKFVYLIVAIVCVVISCLLKIKNYVFVSYIRNIGIIYGVILIMIGSAIKLIIDALKGNIGEYENMISGMIGTVPNTILITGFICLVIGIACFVGYIYIKKNNVKQSVIDNNV